VLGRTEDFSVTIAKQDAGVEGEKKRRKKRRSKRIQRYQLKVTFMSVM
jgi:hypothetical protein